MTKAREMGSASSYKCTTAYRIHFQPRGVVKSDRIITVVGATHPHDIQLVRNLCGHIKLKILNTEVQAETEVYSKM